MYTWQNSGGGNSGFVVTETVVTVIVVDMVLGCVAGMVVVPVVVVVAVVLVTVAFASNVAVLDSADKAIKVTELVVGAGM